MLLTQLAHMTAFVILLLGTVGMTLAHGLPGIRPTGVAAPLHPVTLPRGEAA